MADPSSFRIIRPVDVNDDTLDLTNVPEVPPAAYNAGTTYAAGDTVAVMTGTQAAVYLSLQASNTGNDPALSPDWWSFVSDAYSVYAAGTLYLLDETVTDPTAHRLYKSLVGESKGTATISLANPTVVTRVNHQLAADTPILFLTTGTLPAGTPSGTILYVRNPTADTFNVALTPGGANISTQGHSQSGVHTLYASPNKGYALTDTSRWQDIGPANARAMFDTTNSTQTVARGVVRTVVSVPERVDHVTLHNMYATAAQVIVRSSLGVELFNESYELISTSEIIDAYTYFTEPIMVETEKVISGLPALYSNVTVETILTYPNNNVMIGAQVVGLAKNIGLTLRGAEDGIKDYSRVDFDEFGYAYIVRRNYANTGRMRVVVPSGNVTSVKRTLADFRATPAVFIGTELFANTIYFGIYQQFTLLIEEEDTRLCYCNIDILGLI